MYVMSEPAISVFLLYVCMYLYTYTVLYNDLIDTGYTAPIIRHRFVQRDEFMDP